MFEEIIHNLNQAGLEKERSLGKDARDRLAVIWEQNADIFQLVCANLLLDYITKNNFTKDEYQAYHQAVIDFMLYMSDTLKETNTEVQEL